MSVCLITGLPGHGKSYFGVMQVLEELRRSRRYVVTNLPLNPKEIGAYLDSEGFAVEPEIRDRLRILEPDESAEFYLYDPEGDITKGQVIWEPEAREWHGVNKKQKDAIKVPDFARRQEESYPGVFYVIDEAHLYFDAHAWQTLGTDLSYFVSQHRKLKSDIMFITQHPSKLAKRLRLDLEEWTVVTNLGKVKGWKGVTLPGWFLRETFPGNPDDTNRGEPEKGRFRLNTETIGKFYATSAGVGLAGRVDTQEQERGKHWSRWVWAAAAGCVLAIVLPLGVLKAVGATIGHGLGNYFGGATAPRTNLVSVTPPAPAAVAAPSPVMATVGVPPVSRPVPKADGVYLTGLTPFFLSLSDGRVLHRNEGYRWIVRPGGVYVPGIGEIFWHRPQEATRGSRGPARSVRGEL